MTASIAHEVNNPIAVIQGNLVLASHQLSRSGITVQQDLRATG